jgi:uncharacterized membrane protein
VAELVAQRVGVGAVQSSRISSACCHARRVACGSSTVWKASPRWVRIAVFAIDDVTLAATAIGSMEIRVANWFGPDQPYTRDQVADALTGFASQIVGAHLPARTDKG